jgi:hypothetical protein
MRNIFTFFFIIISLSSFAQNKRVYNTNRIIIEPKIDGKLNDAAWQKGVWAGNFTQRSPHDGAPASQKTFFKVFFTDDYIYVAIKAMDTQADSIDSRMVRRDNDDGDLIGVHFDSYHDLRTSFSFMVNAAGVKSDVLYSNNGDEEDENWNPIWMVKTSKDAQGWYAEIKIPLSQLRFSKNDNKVWGFNVARFIYRNEELSFWNPIPRTSSGWVHNYGELHGISALKPKRILEIAPYASIGLETSEKEDGNPYATGSKMLYGLGLDGKIGITNDFVLDFTFNPDFGQVEADPSEVNLTAFETYQREQRPFFIEGGNILNFKITPGDHDGALDNLFYSRRIGRSPQYFPDISDSEYVDFPMVTKILGALKITGKTKNGLSVGVMESVTREEKASISKKGEERKISVEPLTNYFTARVQQDINKGNTIIGAEINSTNRSINSSNLLFLPKSALSGGLDFAQYWDDRRYFLKTTIVGSSISGDSLSMIHRQTTSQHYFQRPDADYLELDSSKTSLSGYGGNIAVGKSVETGWSYSGNLSWRSPGLALNDMGYLRNADKILQSANIEYKITQPKLFYRSISLGLVQWQGWDFGGNPTMSGGFFYTSLQFKNQWTFEMHSDIDYNMHDNYKLRGGPSFYQPAKVNVRANIETNQTKKFYMDFGFRQAWGEFGYYRKNAWDAGFTYRPIDALSVAFHPNVYTTRDDLQYVSETNYQGKPRYILGQIDQTTLVFRFYVNFNITPDLTIQYFGSPFISSGAYTNFKMVTDASAKTYSNRTHQYTDNEISYNTSNNIYEIDENQDGTIDYTFEKPDFNFKQFQSNLVIRWEFTPGSMLFLVWTQNKTDYDGLGTFDFSHDMDQLFSTTPTNVFMIKLSYRFY